MKLENSVVDGRKHRRAGVLGFFSSGLRKGVLPDLFGKGRYTFLGGGFGVFRGFASFVLGLFHIVMVARRDGYEPLSRQQLKEDRDAR